DHFLVQLQNLAQSLSTCSSQKLDEDLRLHLLQNRSVTCNDGSAAGLLPYCSSDLWSGTRPKTEDSGYAFMGALIIKEVVKELLLKGLDKAKVLLLAGVSAGGIGVLVNVDQVAEQLRSQGHRGVQVRGLSDSGWFLERGQYKPGDCAVVQSCGLIDAAQLGARSWVDVQLRGTSLPKALRCWEQSLQDTRLSSGNHGNYNQTKERSATVRSCPLHLVDRCLWPNCNPTSAGVSQVCVR
ncbi:unnamed protein product, partial [Tetraodon nigroviridis]